jgi:predicted nucleic acid-binding protein
MNVIDSSGWLEYFTDGPNADFFRSAIKNEARLLVPSICLYEVFKIILMRAGEEEALHVIGLMSFGKIVDLDREIALAAGQVSLQNKLAMADAMIYATAQANDATLWTQDEHFKDLPGVKYVERKSL